MRQVQGSNLFQLPEEMAHSKGVAIQEGDRTVTKSGTTPTEGPSHGCGETFPLFHVGSQTAKPITADLEIEGQTVQMEVDTGAAVSHHGTTAARVVSISRPVPQRCDSEDLHS